MTILAMAAARLLQYVALNYGPRPSSGPAIPCQRCKQNLYSAEDRIRFECCDTIVCYGCLQESIIQLGNGWKNLTCPACWKSEIIPPKS